MNKAPSTHNRGLETDLREIGLQRRKLLQFMAAATALPLIGCGSVASAGASSGGDNDTDSTGSDSTTDGCSPIPSETEGPYPGDGSNDGGLDVLTTSGIVRSDIRGSVGAYSGTADGVQLTSTITLVNTKDNCAPLVGYAIYLWHCDRDGKYSLYDVTNENYLRGVQVTDSNGQASFTSIFPACYSGRWPHIHFEVYPDASSATVYTNKVWTTQLAMPQSIASNVYNNASGYSASVQNLAKTSLSSDMVFSDGYSLQIPSFTGDITSGYNAGIVVGLAR